MYIKSIIIILISRKIFSKNFDFKNWCKNEFPDSEKGFPTKSISQPFVLKSPIRQRGSEARVKGKVIHRRAMGIELNESPRKESSFCRSISSKTRIDRY